MSGGMTTRHAAVLLAAAYVLRWLSPSGDHGRIALLAARDRYRRMRRNEESYRAAWGYYPHEGPGSVAAGQGIGDVLFERRGSLRVGKRVRLTAVVNLVRHEASPTSNGFDTQSVGDGRATGASSPAPVAVAEGGER